VTDTAGGAVDEHPLPSLQPPVVEESLPSAQPCERERGALDMTERSRLRQQRHRRRNDKLGGRAITVKRQQTVHRLTDRNPIDAHADRSNDARELIGGNRRKTIGRPFQLVAREPRRVDTHQRLSLDRLGYLDLVQRQRFGSGRSVQSRGSHRAPLIARSLSSQQDSYKRE
jgi:hypothetical protein